MKKYFLFCSLISILFFGCAKEQSIELQGDFLYIADAAVIKGDDFVYGVVIDSVALQLADRAKAYKKGDFDMVPVTVKGILMEKEKDAEGWDTIIKIEKIISVRKPEIEVLPQE